MAKFLESFISLLSKRLKIIIRLDAGDDVCHLYLHGKSFHSCSFRSTSISEVFLNPLFPLENPLRAHCVILKYEFSNRAGLKSLTVLCRIISIVCAVRNMKL